MASGKIKNLVRERGFGFIQTEVGAQEVFFHRTSVKDDGFDILTEGQSVEFEVEADPRNPSRKRATNVRSGA